MVAVGSAFGELGRTVFHKHELGKPISGLRFA
jgi:hypothetical protein